MKKGLRLALMLIMTVLFLSACGKTTYEIDKEINVEFNGYDEFGKSSVNIDKDGLYTAISNTKKLKDQNDVQELEALISDLDVQATPNEDLKNGDKIDLELIYNEDNALKLNLKLKNSTITVDKLDPITTLSKDDIFAGIDIQYEGISPFLKATITENSSSEVSGLFNYSAPKDRLTIDDEIEIIAEPNSDLLDDGYKAEEKDFNNSVKVPNTKKYVQAWDDLNKDDQKYITEEIQDLVVSQIDSKMKDGSNSISEKGNYITTGRYIADSDAAVLEEEYLLFMKKEKFEDQAYHNTDALNSVRFMYKSKITFGDVSFNSEYSNKTKDYFSLVGASHLILDEAGDLIRNEVNFSVYNGADTDKETVKNEALYKLKDRFTIDEIKVDNKK